MTYHNRIVLNMPFISIAANTAITHLFFFSTAETVTDRYAYYPLTPFTQTTSADQMSYKWPIEALKIQVTTPAGSLAPITPTWDFRFNELWISLATGTLLNNELKYGNTLARLQIYGDWFIPESPSSD